MNKSLFDIANEAIKNKVTVSEPPDKEVSKQNKPKKLGPHLAVCASDNPSANNRHSSLLLKSQKNVGFVSLVKSEDEATEFEEFCKTLTNPSVLLELYVFAKHSGEQDLIKSIVNHSKD